MKEDGDSKVDKTTSSVLTAHTSFYRTHIQMMYVKMSITLDSFSRMHREMAGQDSKNCKSLPHMYYKPQHFLIQATFRVQNP